MDPSDAFRALGHPHRLAIVRVLRQRALSCCRGDRVEDCTLDPASCNVGALAEAVPCAPSTLSHHLRALEGAGIIERSRDGRQLLCRLNEEGMADLARFLAPGGFPRVRRSEADRRETASSTHRPGSEPARQGAPHGD